jgi:hypothetical protein
MGQAFFSGFFWMALARPRSRAEKAFGQVRELVGVEVRRQRRAQALRVQRAVDGALDELEAEGWRLGDLLARASVASARSASATTRLTMPISWPPGRSAWHR